MKTSPPRCALALRRIILTATFLAFFAGAFIPTLSRADIVIEGRKLPWTATVPSFWFGGTAEMMERLLARGGSTDDTDQTFETLLRELLPEAKSLDAFFCHLDTTGRETDTISFVRINVIGSTHAMLGSESERMAFWRGTAPHLLKRHPEGSKAEVTGQRALQTAGRAAYTFSITRPDGGRLNEVWHLVVYDAGHTHVFSLVADTRKFRARYNELEALLKSLKYVISGRELPWRAEMPGGWIGGSEQLMKTFLAETDDADYRDLMTRMLREAKTLDVFLIHFRQGRCL